MPDRSSEAPTGGPGAASRTPLRRLTVACGLIALVLASAFVRIDLTLRDPNFRVDSPERMLKSDPALLYYFVESIVDAGGCPPPDFHANTHVEYPSPRDIPRVFTTGEEFFLAWTYLLLGRPVPLHVFCVIALAVFASLAVVGVWGLAQELTGRARWGLFAGLLFVLLPANYRTVGAIIIREDFSLPWLALHLYLLARAVRVRTVRAHVLAAAALVVAVATWHAMRFLVTIEACCLFAWILRSGRNPLEDAATWPAAALLVAASLLIPVLGSTLFIASVPMGIVIALWVAAIWRRIDGRARPRIACIVSLCALLAVGRLLDGGGADPYSHVLSLVISKLRTLGRLPEDPAAIPFEVRLLWQGPFETTTIVRMFGALLAGMLLLPVAAIRLVPKWFAGTGDARAVVLTTFTLITAAAAYFVERLLILPGLLLAVVIALLVDRTVMSSRRAWAIGLLVAYACFFLEFASGYWVTWYVRPQQEEMASVIDWVRKNVPADAAIAADLVTGPAVLAHAGNPIVMQPKYETKESRERIREFLEVFFHGSARSLTEWMSRYRCRYLLLDRSILWNELRYVAGVPASARAPDVGTPAYMLMFDADPASAARSAGMTLVYRSPASLGTDSMRVYECAR